MKYCADREIAVEVRSQGWLLIMEKGPLRRFAFGYDLGLNSSATHRIAEDKSATAEVLESCGIPCVPHTLFLSPKLSGYVPSTGSWETMLRLLEQNPNGIVIKPNDGTGGNGVYKVHTKLQLELAVSNIFVANRGLAISPYLAIDREVRVVLIDYVPFVVYSKSRPSVVGDGKRSVLQLALATIPADHLSAVLSNRLDDLDQSIFDSVPPAGQWQALNWRHNLARGAQPVLLDHGATWQACVDLALEAARAISLRFGSVDVVQVDGSWRVLEINSGVMMEALGEQHPELVDAAYRAALDALFT